MSSTAGTDQASAASHLTMLPMYGHTCGNRSPGHLSSEMRQCLREGGAEPEQRADLPGDRHPPTESSPAPRGQRRVGGGVCDPRLAARAGCGGSPHDQSALAFAPIKPVDHELLDEMTVPAGYDWKAIIRWGDPLFRNSPAFDPALPNGDAQELQFGYNNDYLDILVQDRQRPAGAALLQPRVRQPRIMFPPFTGAQELEAIKATIAAVGFSVVELERNGRVGRGATCAEAGRTAGSPPPHRSG